MIQQSREERGCSDEVEARVVELPLRWLFGRLVYNTNVEMQIATGGEDKEALFGHWRGVAGEARKGLLYGAGQAQEARSLAR